MSETGGIWVYAVRRSVPSPRLTLVSGVAGAAIKTVQAAGLTAVISEVDLAEFGAEPLRRNLEDLDWLEAVARAHHSVVEAAATQGPLVPMRLATVYGDQSGVADMLAARRALIHAGIDRVTGRMEWGVKAFASDAPAQAGDEAAAELAGPASGVAYLNRRRAQLSASEKARGRAAYLAERLHAELSGAAEAAELHRPQDPQLSGSANTMLMNATYLVGDRHAAGFRAAVDQAVQRYPALRLQLTGPWPPYSFAFTDASQA